MKRFYFRKKSLGLLTAVGFLFWFAEADADPGRYPQFAQQQPSTGAAPEFIYLDQLVDEILQQKRPVIIDVRSLEEYQEAHIKGSISIPLSEISSRLAAFPKDRPVVLY